MSIVVHRFGLAQRLIAWALVVLNAGLFVLGIATTQFLIPSGVVEQYGRYRGLDSAGAINRDAITAVLGHDAAADWGLVAEYLFSDVASACIRIVNVISIGCLTSAVVLSAVLISSRARAG